jgi:AcrR family transcriptional regulator
MARPRLVSDEEICSAVRKGVLEQGPQVSLDLIADRLGVTTPALFKRFGSRNALLLAALKLPENPRFITLLESGPDEFRPFETQLHEIIDAHMQFLDECWPCMAALRESGIPKEAVKELMGKGPMVKAVMLFSNWLERAHALRLADIPEPEAIAMAVLGAGQAPIMIRHMQKHLGGRAPSVDGFSRIVARIVSRGLHPSSARHSTPKKRLSS